MHPVPRAAGLGAALALALALFTPTSAATADVAPASLGVAPQLPASGVPASPNDLILPCAGGMTLGEARAMILDATNAQRALKGKRPLTRNDDIDLVAQKWSAQQAKDKKMKHNPKVASQIPANWRTWGENVAYGYHVHQVTPAWILSPPHRQNIEKTTLTHIGIGVACSSNGSRYFTQVFAGYNGQPKPWVTGSTPKLTGKAKAGITLTAVPGTWMPGTTLSYQWYANGKKISGATKATFTPKQAQVGKKITVKVTGKKSGHTTVTKTSKATAKVAKYSKLKSPVPKVTGTAKAGLTLKATNVTWTSGTALSYQWYANGKKISGATSKTYTLKQAQVGKRITVKVTGKKVGYSTTSKTSKATVKVAKYSTLKTATPKITAAFADDQIVLTAAPGAWTSGTTRTYQWYAAGIAIPDATGSALTLSPELHGMPITVKVTGKKAGYKAASKISAAGSYTLLD